MGGSWGAPGAQEVFLQIHLLHFEPFWVARGGSRGPLGGPWAAFGPSWRVFGRSRGRFLALSGAVDYGAGKRVRSEAIFGRFWDPALMRFRASLLRRRRCFFVVFWGPFPCPVASCPSSFLFCAERADTRGVL